MKNRPSIRQLQYVVVLYETESFRKAADICCVSQSTISAALRELEEQLGVVLFERTNRSVQPSRECEMIIRNIRKVIEDIDDLVARAKGAESVFYQPQRIGVIHTIAPYLLPHILPFMHKNWPLMKLYLREGKTEQLLDELSQNKIDMVIMAFPYPLDSSFEKKMIMEDSFSLAVLPDHKLAKKKYIEAKDIPVNKLLLLEDGHCLRDHASEACMLEPAVANKAYSGTSLDTLLHMVILGMGVTLLPNVAVESQLMANRGVEFRPLKPSLPSRKIGLVWRSTSAHKHEYQEIVEKIAKMVR